MKVFEKVTFLETQPRTSIFEQWLKNECIDKNELIKHENLSLSCQLKYLKVVDNLPSNGQELESDHY